jgi:hypothetical protein
MDRYAAIITAIKWLARQGIKTEPYMRHTIEKLVKDLYKENITKDVFDGRMFDLFDEQMRRAFNAGMRANGLDPAVHMTDAWRQIYQDKTLSQVEFIDKFSNDILSGRTSDTSLSAMQPYLDRVDLWSNQYNNMVREAQLITAEPGTRFVWVLGATEQHCSTCASLDGVIHTAEAWQELGLHPGQPPNPMLECGGWRCDCRLEVTDEKPILER